MFHGIEYCDQCSGKSGYHARHCSRRVKSEVPPAQIKPSVEQKQSELSTVDSCEKQPPPRPYVNKDRFLIFDVKNRYQMNKVFQMLPEAWRK